MVVVVVVITFFGTLHFEHTVHSALNEPRLEPPSLSRERASVAHKRGQEGGTVILRKHRSNARPKKRTSG